MEGLLYLQKYGISGPESGIKEEFLTEKGRQIFHARAMNRKACCLQLGQVTSANWNHILVSGFTRERRLLHPTTTLRPSTNERLTELKTFSPFQLQNYKDSFTNSLTKVERRLKKRGIGNPMYFNRRVFLLNINARSSNCIQKSNSLLFHWWVTLTLLTGTETWLVKFEGNVHSTHCTFLVKVSSVLASFCSEKVINVIFIIFMLWLWNKFKSVSIHSYACDICNLPVFSMCVSFKHPQCSAWAGKELFIATNVF